MKRPIGELVVQLRTLLADATSGTWEVHEGDLGDGSIYIDADPDGDRPVAMLMSGSPHERDRKDAALIVAAVNNLPQLLDAIEGRSHD